MTLRTIRARLRVAAAVIAVMLLAAAAFGWMTVRRLSHDIEQNVAEAVRVQALTNRFTLDVADELRAAEDYILQPTANAAGQFTSRGRDAHQLQAVLVRSQLAIAARDSASDAELLARIDDELSQLEVIYARAHRLVDLGATDSAKLVIARRDVAERRLNQDISLLSAHEADRVADLGAAMRETAIEGARLLVAMLLIAIGVISAFVWRLGRSITRPLAALVAHAEALRRGARDQRTSTVGLPGEYEALAAAMNHASESLESLARTEAALNQAEKLAALGTLISGVAHELNNPLQSILLTAELLRYGTTDVNVRADLETIADQVVRARTIITDLLTTVRPENAMRDSASLETALQGLETELTRLAERHGAVLSFTMDSPLPPVLVDRVAFAQVMTNLVANGAQAAGEGGSVRVRAGRCAGGCEIVIDDSGPGIPPEIIKRIFEPFFSTKEVGRGTGLGLPVSRGIIESMHGTLTADAHWGGESTGARFSIVLPVGIATAKSAQVPSAARRRELAAPDRGAWTATSSGGDERRSGGDHIAVRERRMLVVDDEPAIQQMLHRYFTRRNWIVDCAADGADALSQIEMRVSEGEAYAIMFCDLRMPTMSGVQLHDVLLRRHPDLPTELVFLSGDIVSDDIRQFTSRTACEILRKPLDAHLMETHADRAWTRHAGRELRLARALAHA